MLKVGVSGIDFTVSTFEAHDMGILTIDPSVSVARAVVAQTNAVIVVNCMALFPAPHAFLWHTGLSFSDLVLDRPADLADLHFGEGRGNVKRGVNVML